MKLSCEWSHRAPLEVQKTPKQVAQLLLWETMWLMYQFARMNLGTLQNMSDMHQPQEKYLMGARAQKKPFWHDQSRNFVLQSPRYMSGMFAIQKMSML